MNFFKKNLIILFIFNFLIFKKFYFINLFHLHFIKILITIIIVHFIKINYLQIAK